MDYIRVLLKILRDNLPLFAGGGTLAGFHFHGDAWLVGLTDPLVATALFAWIFAAMLWSAFGVVHHADRLAGILREPYGTLVLTAAVIVIEVSLIAAIMLTGEAAPTLARDTMMAVLMLVLNGLIGSALLIGGLLHREQDYNLPGARAFLSVLIPLAVFALVLPDFTVSTAAPTFSPGQALFFALLTAALYAVFLAIQTGRYNAFFRDSTPVRNGRDGMTAAGAQTGAQTGPAADPAPDVAAAAATGGGAVPRPGLYHAVFLVLTLIPIVLLSTRMAVLVDFGTSKLGAPTALGGIVIAFLVLTPEGIAAMKAAIANHLQRSVNLLLGAALSTIGLTVPAVLAIGLVTGKEVVLGLDQVGMVLLLLTLLVSSITFGGGRTNLLQGAVHLVIFLAYLGLVFNP